MRFQGQVVWITGASSGIGAALAHAFSREGAILILSSRDRRALEEVRLCLPGDQNEAHVVPIDLASPAAIPDRTAEVLDMFGRVDILVHNAGLGQRAAALETDPAVVRRIFDINFFGVMALTKSLLPAMIRDHGGRIAVVSSVLGKFGAPGRSAYAASKHALHGYFDSLRTELHPHNIGVTLLCPGYVRTDISLHALRGDGSPHGEMDPGQARGMSPELCAARMLSAIHARKEEAVIGGWTVWAALQARRLFPGAFYRVLRRLDVD